MAVTLEGFAAYARLNPDSAGDPTAQLCLDAAQAHAAEVGIPSAALADNAKYMLFIYALALHYYDNRGFLPSSQAYAVDEYTRRMMTKFRMELASEGW